MDCRIARKASVRLVRAKEGELATAALTGCPFTICGTLFQTVGSGIILFLY
jgi:hypothetical protein